jgi:hypothetical protein
MAGADHDHPAATARSVAVRPAPAAGQGQVPARHWRHWKRTGRLAALRGRPRTCRGKRSGAAGRPKAVRAQVAAAYQRRLRRSRQRLRPAPSGRLIQSGRPAPSGSLARAPRHARPADRPGQSTAAVRVFVRHLRRANLALTRPARRRSPSSTRTGTGRPACSGRIPAPAVPRRGAVRRRAAPTPG